MYLKEISSYSWIIIDNLLHRTLRLKHIDVLEMENHISILRCGPDLETPLVLIDCTYQQYITKYKKSALFTLTEITTSSIYAHEDLGPFVLGIKGTMPLEGIMIKKKKRKKMIISEERKKELRILMSKVQSDHQRKLQEE